MANALLNIPGNGLILMRVSSDVGAVQHAAIPLRRIVNEGDFVLRNSAGNEPGTNFLVDVEVVRVRRR